MQKEGGSGGGIAERDARLLLCSNASKASHACADTRQAHTPGGAFMEP